MGFKTKKLKFIAFDLDGTLANTQAPSFSLEKAKAIKPTTDLVRSYFETGLSPFIWSSRHWDDYGEVKDWLEKNQIPFQAIWLGKPLVREVWDDRAYNPDCSECWERAKKNNTT